MGNICFLLPTQLHLSLSIRSSIPFSEDLAKQILSEKEIEILVSLNAGDTSATAWGCDLTYDYVKINGDYRT